MLGLLYLMFLEPPGAVALRILFVTHLGLFVLWQPIIERNRELSGNSVMIMGVAVVMATFSLNAWVLVLWTVLLAGVVGGKVLLAGSLRLRFSYLMALAYLAIGLLVFALPSAVPEAVVIESVRQICLWCLPLMLVVVFALATGRVQTADSEVLDLVNSLLLVLLLSVLVLGTLASMLLFKLSYLSALVQSLFALAGFLALLGWLWSPHFGFSGLQSLFSRYLASIGMPAQEWLQALADLNQREENPERFFAAACADLAERVVWIRGLEWKLSENSRASGLVGRPSGERTSFRHPESEVHLYTRYPLPPSVVLHVNLLTQLLAEFYADKQRAQRLRELSYLRAVHETGARLTHDVKNLLQSMQTLIYAAENSGESESEAFRFLMRRQLPAISTRLATTLERLRTPADEPPDNLVRLDDWWRAVCDRYGAQPWLTFVVDEQDSNTLIPEAVFSCVLDNLIANGADKRARQPELRMRISATQVRNRVDAISGVTLEVADDGEPVPLDIANNLFLRPIDSRNGLGIGLYQAARLAASAHYALALCENTPGQVRFALQRAD